tara:strand:+ start:927 stop:1634 length:708 start_codon:yes stop_codon:yes gene_type:complete
MKNKVAIITGASTGIGKHISIELSKNDYTVILISRNINKLNNVKDIIDNLGKKCIIIESDISKESSIECVFKELSSFNNIDILINNAGLGIFNKIDNTSYQDWDIQMNTNLKASFMMTKNIVPLMKKKNSGKIVFINSVAGLKGYPYSSAYVASKYGLRGFASSIREELREYNIKVISIHPGAIDTPFWNEIKGDFPREKMLSPIDVSKSIVGAVLSPGNVVQEELIIRSTYGDL